MYGRRLLKIFFGLLVLISSFLLAQSVFAQFGVNEVGAEIALPEEDPRIIAARIIRAALGFLGIVALGIVLYGGFVWMTSGGNEEKISKAKKILTNGLIGLIIIVFAFSITQFILSRLMEAVSGVGVPGTPTGPPVVGRYEGALGNGIIDSHYPPRGGTGIPRNTKIIITFKEPMQREDFLVNYNDNGTPDNLSDDWGDLNSNNVKIYISDPDMPGSGEGLALTSTQAKVTFTSDLKTFVFDPIDLLGSPSENIWYTVAIKPEVKKADGSNAFVGAFRDGYAWDFEVSTFIDTTPPKVINVIPVADDIYSRNILVQINFNEAMDPTTVSGKTTEGFDKISVLADGSKVEGIWTIGNQYRTVEFMTNDKCGTNSCGGDVFCLPASADIAVTVKAASLSGATPPSPEPPEAVWPYDGATDAVGNSLDGNGNDIANGPPADNYEWSFKTNNTIDLTPPRIENVEPSVETSNVDLGALIKIRFSKLMSITSFTSENIILEDNQRDECAIWYYFGSEELDSSNNSPPMPRPATWRATKHQAIIHHRDFIESTEDPVPAPLCSDGAEVDERLVRYFPRVTHRVKDLFQNCFYEVLPPEGPKGPAGGWTCTSPGGPCQWEVE